MSGVLVAGGASGLGAAVARRLADLGHDVVVLDLRAPAEPSGRFVEGDVLDPDAVARAVEAASSSDALRIAVNCAGIAISERTVGRDGPHDLDRFERVLRVNLVGTFNVLRVAAARMSENEPGVDGERGVIVNTASIAAFEPQIGQAAYGASKGGIVALTLAAARDLAARGIRVVAIAPGIFDTPLLGALPDEVRASLGDAVPYPKRLGRPEEYAQLVEQVVSNRMLNGATIRLDGALRMPPR